MIRTIEQLIADRKRPIRVDVDASVLEAVEAMNGDSAGSVLVIGPGEELVGIFTERDVLTRVLETGRDAETTRVGEVMTPTPLTIEADTTLEEAVARMRRDEVCHLPVIDQGELVGIVALRDLAAEMTKQLRHVNQSLVGYIHGPLARAID